MQTWVRAGCSSRPNKAKDENPATDKAWVLAVTPLAVQVDKVVLGQVVEEVGSMYPTVVDHRSMGELHGECLQIAKNQRYTRLIHVFTRPEDIFGSVEVDGNGNFVGNNGNYQSSGQHSDGALIY